MTSKMPSQFYIPSDLSLTRQSGLSLVELMISLLLGLIVSGAVMLVFIANKDAYRLNENISRAQESGRYSLVRLNRTIREADGIACGSNIPRANALLNPGNNWWSDWSNGIEGFEGNQNTFPQAFGANSGDRVNGTDAIILHNATEHTPLSLTTHNAASSEISLNNTGSPFLPGDIVIACDFQQATLFQLSTSSAGSSLIDYTASSSISPGNCTQGLGSPTVCANPGTPYTFAAGGIVAKLSATAWFIGNNVRGTRSLYRLSLDTSSSAAVTRLEEIVDEVSDLQIQYLEKSAGGTLASSYVDADAVTDWQRVVAVRLSITQVTAQAVTTDRQRMEIQWHTVVSLRNRSI